MTTTIRVSGKEKITSIRVTEKTKRELESFGIGGESHEQILKKVLNLTRDSLFDSKTKIIQKHNAQKITYNRINEIINIELDDNTYSATCVYNDLSIMNLIRNQSSLREPCMDEWEIDLEIVNVMTTKKDYSLKVKKQQKWIDPQSFKNNHPKEYLFIYLVTIKHILEKTFKISIYEMLNKPEYFDINKWEHIYKRYNLSMESYYTDIQKKLR